MSHGENKGCIIKKGLNREEVGVIKRSGRPASGAASRGQLPGPVNWNASALHYLSSNYFSVSSNHFSALS